MWRHEAHTIDKMTKEEFKNYYNNNFSHIPVHFSIVLLKSKDGLNIKSIIEKPGTLNVRISPLRGIPSNEDERDNMYIFIPSPAKPYHVSPIYKKK